MRAVLERDFLAEVSRPRAFWFRAAAAAAVSIVLLIVVLENRTLFREAPDRVARYLFAGGAFTVLGLLALLTPVGVVGSILEERQRETLALVLSAPGRPTGFALAKLLSRAAAVFAWALATLVPLSGVLLLGGVAGRDVADFLLMAGAVVLELAAWGVWVSSVTRRLATGAVLAYLLPAMRWGVVLLVCFPILGRGWNRQVWPEWTLQASWAALATTPLPACLRMADQRDYDRFVALSLAPRQIFTMGPPPMVMAQGPGRIVVQGSGTVSIQGGRVVRAVGVPIAPPPPPPPPPVPVFARQPALIAFAFSVLWVLLALFAAGKRLEREAEPRVGLLARWKGGRRWFRSLPGRGNPMVWKESRLLNTSASRPLFYSVLALLVLGEIVYFFLLGAGWIHSREVVQAGMWVAAAQSCLLGLVAAIAGASSMAHERSTGSLDLLRTTLLTPPQIYRGKIAGAAMGLGFLAVVPVVVHLGILAAVGALHPLTALLGVVVLAVTVLAWLAVGMVAGILSFRTGKAVALASAAFALAFAGIPFLGWVLEDGLRMHDASEALFGVWPPGTVYNALESASFSFPGSDWGGSSWRPRWDDHHFAAVVTLIVLVVGTAAFHARAHRLLAWRLRREGEEG